MSDKQRINKAGICSSFPKKDPKRTKTNDSQLPNFQPEALNSICLFKTSKQINTETQVRRRSSFSNPKNNTVDIAAHLYTEDPRKKVALKIERLRRSSRDAHDTVSRDLQGELFWEELY